MHTENSKKYLFVAWAICGLGALYYMYEYFLRISPSFMESALRDHFNLSAYGFGILSVSYYYAYVPMQVPVGVMMDRYGPRVLLTLACLVCVIGTYLFASTTNVYVAGMGRFLVGFGSAFAFVGVLKLATLWLPENKMAMVAGLAAALGTFGGLIGDNYLGDMVIKFGWQHTLNVTAALGVGLTALLWFGIRDSKKMVSHSGTISTFKKSMTDLLIIARNKQIWINGLYGCLVYLPTTVFAELWGISYLKNAHGLSQEVANYANSLIFLGFAIGAPTMGWISDKLARRKLPMILGAAGAAVVMMMILYLPNLDATRIETLMFLLGFLYSSQCIVFAVGRELSPAEAAGTAMAMTNMIVMLGAMICQPLVGFLLNFSLSTHVSSATLQALSHEGMKKLYTADDYQFALSIIPIGILIAGLLTFFLKETHADVKQ